MSRHNLGEKNMNDKYIKQIRKALTEIVGLDKLGYDESDFEHYFIIKKGKFQDYGSGHAGINDAILVDGFYVEIDYDFWKDEKHKLETFHHLARYFPNIERLDDDDLCHISLDGDNFGGINA